MFSKSCVQLFLYSPLIRRVIHNIYYLVNDSNRYFYIICVLSCPGLSRAVQGCHTLYM
nr:MAG TPA: hypothetical protein [Caudoviricetes sp.]